jgi:hypothetical protein
VCVDVDGDGICSERDNCPGVANLNQVDAHIGATRAGMLGRDALPLDEERKLRVAHEIENPDLLPTKFVPVRVM